MSRLVATLVIALIVIVLLVGAGLLARMIDTAGGALLHRFLDEDTINYLEIAATGLFAFYGWQNAGDGRTLNPFKKRFWTDPFTGSRQVVTTATEHGEKSVDTDSLDKDK